MPAAGLEARINALRHLRGPSWFATSEDVRGADQETGLEVTADVTGWLIDVQVPDDPTLRTASGLEDALHRALASALAAHLLDNARVRVLSEFERQRAADLLAGRTTLTAPRITPTPPVEVPRHPVHPRAYTADTRWGRRWTGTSREGEVRVTMSLPRGFEGITVADGFLESATPDLVRHALREAFADVARAHDSQQEVDIP